MLDVHGRGVFQKGAGAVLVLQGRDVLWSTVDHDLAGKPSSSAKGVGFRRL
jgi:hypothetical protein